MHDEKTKRGWPLPHRENLLADDVERIRNAFIAIDAEFSKIVSDLDTKIFALDAKLDEQISHLDSQSILDALGFFFDEDGDLCYGDRPDTPSSENPNTEIPSEQVASDEEIDEMLKEIFG